MRQKIGPKFWSQGTNLGCPRALGATPGVVEKFRMVILFTFMMLYITTLFTFLGYFFLLTCASVVMWFRCVWPTFLAIENKGHLKCQH